MNLSRNKELNEEDFSILSKMKFLEELYFNGCNLSSGLTSKLEFLGNLEIIEIVAILKHYPKW